MSFYSKLAKYSYKFCHPIIGEIWCLHRVTTERSIFSSNRDLEITPAYLEKLILDYKKNGYLFTNLDAIYEKLQQSMFLKRKKMVNISFDDGFVDIYHYAFPIFCKYNIPFTIYLTSDFPNKKAKLWWIALDLFIRENDVIVLGDNTTHICHTQEQKQLLFEELLTRIYESDKTPLAFFTELFPDVYTTYENKLNSLVLSWSMLSEMVRSGLCTMGSHTVSHPILTKLNYEEIMYEMEYSARYIADKLHCKVEHFSYPHSSTDDRIEKMVSQVGYKTAILGYGGNIRIRDNPYMLHRNYIIQPEKNVYE